VNDLSDRKTLLRYPLNLKSSQDLPYDSLLRVCQSHEVHSTPLPAEALELRAFKNEVGPREVVFVRTKHSLMLVNDSEEEVGSVICGYSTDDDLVFRLWYLLLAVCQCVALPRSTTCKMN